MSTLTITLLTIALPAYKRLPVGLKAEDLARVGVEELPRQPDEQFKLTVDHPQ